MMKDLVLSWKAPEDLSKLELKHFAPALLLHPAITMIVIGTGDKSYRIDPKECIELIVGRMGY